LGFERSIDAHASLVTFVAILLAITRKQKMCSIKAKQGESLIMKTHVSAKGQIVIPAAIRKKYGIKNGTKIIVTDIGNGIVLKPITEQYLKNLQGSLRGKGGLKILLTVRREDKQN
jgi:AbrB family looped-hinge helix DNA binding protein